MNEVLKSGQITDSDRMFKDLALVIHDKFMEVGLELGLEYQTLCNELEVMKKGSDKAMKMLQLWKQSIIGDNFTYSVLAIALEKNGLQQAAHKFCYTEASSSNLQSKAQQCVETCEAPTANSGNNPPPTVASEHLLNSQHSSLGQYYFRSPSSSLCSVSPSILETGRGARFEIHHEQIFETILQPCIDCTALLPRELAPFCTYVNINVCVITSHILALQLTHIDHIHVFSTDRSIEDS